MRKINLCLGFLLIAGCISINAQNPLKQYGYEKEFLTLSKGHFNEFFCNDTVMQIGTVLFNTITNKIIGFVKEDINVYSFSSGDVSRWLSVDPHAENYYSYSPYTYCLDNPIIFLTPMVWMYTLIIMVIMYMMMVKVTS